MINSEDTTLTGDRAVSRDAVIKLAYDMSEIDGEHFSEPHMVVDVEEIQKLPPITPQPCENAISREEVLLMIDTFKDNYGSLIDLSREVRKMPPVDPQLKTGHWIIGRIFPTKITDENLIEYRCSECDRAIRCTESQLVNYPYCHCGAKMIEPQESEDV